MGLPGSLKTAYHNLPSATTNVFFSLGQAISALLDGEMSKVAEGAETDRRGAMLKKLKQVERRSGGLCNPELIQKVVRSSSTDGSATAKNLLSAPASPSSTLASPRQSSPKERVPATPTASNLVVVDVDVDVDAEDVVEVGGAAVGDAAQDIPWAEDLLSLAVRKRNAALLKTRGRALAKGLARMLNGVSKELKGVASRLPPWEEEDEEPPAAQEEMVRYQRQEKSAVHDCIGFRTIRLWSAVVRVRCFRAIDEELLHVFHVWSLFSFFWVQFATPVDLRLGGVYLSLPVIFIILLWPFFT